MSSGVLSLLIIVVIAIVFLTDRFPVAVVTMAGAIVCGILGLMKQYKSPSRAGETNKCWRR